MPITEHGGNPLGLNDVLDFSANINPLGITENIRSAFIRSAGELEKYPDPYCVRLRKRIAEHTGTDMADIVCGNGADDLIYRIVCAVRPEKALICSPAFSEYRKALMEYGCGICDYILKEENGFEVTKDILSHITDEYDMFFLCHPNNPTGRSVSPEILSDAAEICLRKGVILVCDESFIELTDSRSILPCVNKNVIVVRSMTKSRAIPGVRLGYAVFGNTSIAEKTAGTGQFWSVSAPAQRVGEATFDDTEFLVRTSAYIKKEREYLFSQLEKYVEKVYPSDANFILFRSETDLGERMLEHGILIRDCSNYRGLKKGFFRTAVRRHEENEILINTLRRLRNG